MPDFELAKVEFISQANLLRSLIQIVDAASAAELKPEYSRLGLPALAPGGKNTMAAAALVLLAAHFEEHVRQQVQECARLLMENYSSLGGADREKFLDHYWRGGIGQMSRIRPKFDPLWLSSAERELRSLLAFPVAGDGSAFVAKLISDHENNMRWETIIDLTGRVRIKKLGEKMYEHAGLRNLVGAVNEGEFATLVKGKLGEFYNLRNSIVHSISQASGIGQSVFSEWADFLVQFALAFEGVLTSSNELEGR